MTPTGTTPCWWSEPPRWQLFSIDCEKHTKFVGFTCKTKLQEICSCFWESVPIGVWSTCDHFISLTTRTINAGSAAWEFFLVYFENPLCMEKLDEVQMNLRCQNPDLVQRTMNKRASIASFTLKNVTSYEEGDLLCFSSLWLLFVPLSFSVSPSPFSLSFFV